MRSSMLVTNHERLWYLSQQGSPRCHSLTNINFQHSLYSVKFPTINYIFVFTGMFFDKKKLLLQTEKVLHRLMLLPTFFLNRIFLEMEKIKLPEDRKSIQEVENKNRTKVIPEKKNKGSLFTHDSRSFLPPILFYSLFYRWRWKRRVFLLFFSTLKCSISSF